MLNRREVLGAAASAVVAGGRASMRAAAPWQFTLRVVGAAAFVKNEKADGYLLWVPRHNHAAHFVVEERHVTDRSEQSEWKLPGTDPRAFHLALSDGPCRYRTKPVKSFALGGLQKSDSKARGLAKVGEVLKSYGHKEPKIVEDLTGLIQAQIELNGAMILDGPPTGIGIGAGLEWSFHRSFGDDPTAVLSDCVDVVANVDKNPLDGLAANGPMTVWLINEADEELDKDPKELEHGRLYWRFYKQTDDDETKKIHARPGPKVDADFPPTEKGARARGTLEAKKGVGAGTPAERVLSVPYVELCYSASLNF